MGAMVGVLVGPRFRPGLMNGDHHNRKGQSYNIFFIAKELGMRESDVHTLWGSFCEADVTGTGLLKLDDFLVTQKLDNQFGDLCFKVFDLDGSGFLSFEEFVIIMWNLLTLDDSSLPMFAFRIFDSDNSGADAPSSHNSAPYHPSPFMPSQRVVFSSVAHRGPQPRRVAAVRVHRLRREQSFDGHRHTVREGK